MGQLDGKKVAVIALDGFEETELTVPKDALAKEGAEVHVISAKAGSIKAWKNKNWSIDVQVDRTLEQTKPEEYDALVLPGGVMNADKSRRDGSIIAFTAHFLEKGKPLAAICHAPWILIETGIIGGRKLTSYHTLQTDMKNAGAVWVDEEVVVDSGLVTSRHPGDLDAFCRKAIEEIKEGVHETA